MINADIPPLPKTDKWKAGGRLICERCKATHFDTSIENEPVCTTCGGRPLGFSDKIFHFIDPKTVWAITERLSNPNGPPKIFRLCGRCKKNRESIEGWIRAETENGFTEICKLCEKELMDETYCIWLMYLQDKYPGENNSEIAKRFKQIKAIGYELTFQKVNHLVKKIERDKKKLIEKKNQDRKALLN